MRLGVMSLTHHMLNVESICSSALKVILDSECQLILDLTETYHTVFLIDKYWLHAACLSVDAQQLAATDLDSRVSRSLWISGPNVNEDQHLQVPARKFIDEEERLSICRHEHPFTGLISVCRDDRSMLCFYLVAKSRLVQRDSCDQKARSECLFLHRNDGEFASPVHLESDYLGLLHW